MNKRLRVLINLKTLFQFEKQLSHISYFVPNRPRYILLLKELLKQTGKLVVDVRNREHVVNSQGMLQVFRREHVRNPENVVKSQSALFIRVLLSIHGLYPFCRTQFESWKSPRHK